MNDVFAMLPCYNESENIGPLVEKWIAQKEVLNKAGFRLSIHCIDDKSTARGRSSSGSAGRIPMMFA